MTPSKINTQFRDRRLHLALAFVFWATLASTISFAGTGSEFTAVPPFLKNELKANVMLMMDNSASMFFELYTDSFDPNKSYYGMFDDTKQYRYDSQIGIDFSAYNGTSPHTYTIDADSDPNTNEVQSVPGAFVEATSPCVPALGANCWDGSFLNWVISRRVDAARKVMVGGTVENRAGYDYQGTGHPQWKLIAGNQPIASYWDGDDITNKQYSSSQAYTPYPDNTPFSVIMPAQNGAVQNTYDPYAKLVPTIPTNNHLIYDENHNIIGETGQISDFNHYWRTIYLEKNNYVNPVIVATPPTYNGYEAGVIRISDIQGGSFSIRFEEWEYLNDWHPTEDISYMVIEQGAHTLAGGQKIFAGTVPTSQPANLLTNALTVNISNAGFPAGTIPVILTSVVSNNNRDTVTTRINNVTSAQFEIGLQEEENFQNSGDHQPHPIETVGYIALEQGSYDDGWTTVFEVDSRAVSTQDWNTDANPDWNWATINFNGLSDTPDFFGKIQTINPGDLDPVSLRHQNLTQNSVQVFLEEEQSAAPNRAHANERVGYVIVHHVPPQFNLALVVDEQPTGLLHDIYEKVRLGISFYRYKLDDNIYVDNNANGGTLRLTLPLNPFINNPGANGFRVVDTPIKTNLENIVDGIEHYPMGGSTPLAENYFEVMRYFQQPATGYWYTSPDRVGYIDEYNIPGFARENFLVNDDWDPYFFTEYHKTINCAKSFILLFTDGEPTADGSIPELDGSNDRISVDGLSRDHDSDGNIRDCEDNSNWGLGCGGNLDDLAYWANHNDLRTDTGMTGEQNIITYTVAFANNTIPQILQDAATNGDGIAYSAADGRALEQSLNDAFANILDKTSAGSNVSVQAEKGTAGAIVNQALFFPKKDYLDNNTKFSVAWSGMLNAYWFYSYRDVHNMREDSNSNFILDSYTDQALDFVIDPTSGGLVINHYTVDATDGSKDTLAGTYTSVDDIKKIWESGTLLKNRSVEANPATTSTPDANTSRRVIWGAYATIVNGTKEFHKQEFTTNNYNYFADSFGTVVADFPQCLNVEDSDNDGHVDDDYPSIEARSKNLIRYVRGVADDFTLTKGGPCRNRKIRQDQDGDPSNDIWKLGDFIYSTPQLVEYEAQNIIYITANDGMLHAFNAGKIKKDGLNPDQSAKVTESATSLNITPTTLGKELWSFIPTAVMPYLKYLADPAYAHMYTLDLSPYIITSRTGKKILIAGMRFGGGTTATNGDFWLTDNDNDGNPDSDGNGHLLQIVPKECTPQDAVNGDCLGVSSYFALDITDPFAPELLWEFNDQDLGYSYSGPAYIRQGTDEYVMFASGPTNYRGEAPGHNVHLFILDVDSSFNLTTYVKRTISTITNGFAGRLFTNGIDKDQDGSTDLVMFGVNWFDTGSSSWKGNVFGLAPDSGSPSSWELVEVFPTANKPVISKVGYATCYGDPFMYFGTGRWYYKEDDPGSPGEHETLYGIKLEGCLNNLLDGNALTTCAQGLSGFDADYHGDEVCEDVEDTNTAWSIDLNSSGDIDASNNVYGKERDITDPTVGAPNAVFFTTMEPSTDACAFGGQTRMWGINCMSGHSLFEDGCLQPDGNTYYSGPPPEGTLFLQLSGGDVNDDNIDLDTFSGQGHYTTPWSPGTPSEEEPDYVEDSLPMPADIILWLER